MCVSQLPLNSILRFANIGSWVLDLNIKINVIKFLAENIGENISDIRIDKNVLCQKQNP
jgi:hypothetical protein